jgi:septal ring factor EnvC (AmiA/AmiB activator)
MMFWRRRIMMAILVGWSAIFLSAAPIAKADDEPKPEQLKQMYENTLAQLKSAQERKTQLAAENEQLKAKVVELEKQMQAVATKAADLEKQSEAYAEKTFFLRAHYSAWQDFLRRYPRMQIRWRVFLENDLLTPRNDLPVFVDPDWPWSAQS